MPTPAMSAASRLARIDWSAVRMEALAMLAIGGPIIVHNLALVGMGLTDTVMAGLLGAKTLAAVAVGSNVWAPLFLLSLGVIMAQSPTAAHLYGAGKLADIGRYARQMAWLSQVVGWGGFLVLRNAGPFMQAIRIEPEIVPAAAAYLSALAWGLPGICLYQVLRFTSEGIGRTRILLVIAVGALIVNGVLDYVLMYGKLGFPALGATGTGYATATTQWLMLLALLLYVRRRAFYQPLQIFSRFDWPKLSMQWELMHLGIPIAVGIFMESSLFSGVGLLMGTLGTDIVAGHRRVRLLRGAVGVEHAVAAAAHRRRVHPRRGGGAHRREPPIYGCLDADFRRPAGERHGRAARLQGHARAHGRHHPGVLGRGLPAGLAVRHPIASRPADDLGGLPGRSHGGGGIAPVPPGPYQPGCMRVIDGPGSMTGPSGRIGESANGLWKLPAQCLLTVAAR
jgi:hypothetical protein